MVTKSSSTTLLSRFAQLFRESDADDGADTRQTESPASVAPSEPSLKERIARKKRNDAIKAKELNQLRIVMNNARGIKSNRFNYPATPSGMVRISGMGSLERNSILDKIDGAEAHLENWWGASTNAAPVASSPAATVKPDKSTGPAAFLDDMDLDFTGMPGETVAGTSRPASLAHTQAAEEEEEEDPLSPLDACLRNAALHYAEGEFEDAQNLLSDMLGSPALEPEAAEALTFALFDVFRCAGKQGAFDELALDYANRYGRSPGEWFSLAESKAPLAAGDGSAESSFSQLARETSWRCPAILDMHGLADCLARSPVGATLSFINWEALQHIDIALYATFGAQLQSWCESPVDLHWSGMEELLAAVQMCKVSNDAARDAAWWLIHLDLLRVLHQAEAYENVAMDYCVEFEVSPPSWQPPRCKLVQDADFPVLSEYASTTSSRGSFEEAQAGPTHYTNCELKGNMTGEARRALRALRAASGTVGQITVSCSRLGRVDFNAASALLNWAASSDAKGCQVQFVHLPRLVLVFFEMLGMHKVASLSSGAH